MTWIPPWSPGANPPTKDFQWSSHLHLKILNLHMQLCLEKNCYSYFWDTSVRILALLKPTAKQIIEEENGGSQEKKSRHNTFKSWLKMHPKSPTQIFWAKAVFPLLFHHRQTTYLITNFSNETPTGLTIILGTEVLAIFPFIHTFPLSCWSFLHITIQAIPHPWFTFKPHQN